MRHALIIAGGSGTRFWPASRKAFPKQFLRFGSDLSMLQQTAARVPDLKLWVVCGKAHAELVKKDLPSAQVVVEPAAKNTAPAIALALQAISKDDPNAVIAAFPADQHIRDLGAFRAAVSKAFEQAEQGGLVTIGIKPTRAETGFGYIEQGDKLRFVEKPDQETAQKFFADPRYLWNAGIFVFTAATMHQLIAKLCPEIATFESAPSISIDYAIAEKTDNLKLVPLDAGWSDVGSWDALGEVQAADANGNIGPVLAVDAKNNTTQAPGKTVCLLGVSDLIVVDTPDAILVARRGESQRVREMIAALEKQKPSLL